MHFMNTTPHTPPQPVLVIGGTGTTGRRVARRLADGGHEVRIGSRSGSPRFDWHEPETWGPALKGTRAAYITYYPDLAVPGSAAMIGAFADVAQANGVHRLVLLSGRGEPEAQAAEQALRDSGAEWTIVRASWFQENFSEKFMVESVIAGEVALPVGRVSEPFVSADDIADVAVAALTEDGHANRLYEVTGPRLMTFADAIGEIAKAAGREIEFVSITTPEYLAALKALGEPEEVTDFIGFLFDEVLDGRNESLTDGVQRALGRPPRDFADYAHATAATGAWNAAAPADKV
jgi:uncharacterized protein YbjT (DUF2867 family)